MKIILDFDDTIFNTHQLMQKFLAVFNNLGFTDEEFWNAYKECKKRTGDFDKETLINLLAELNFFDKENASAKIDSVIDSSRNFVYPDFFGFADDFNKKDLTLLSYGTTIFQKAKIEKSKIIPLLNEIIITKNDKIENFKTIAQKYGNEKIFFIDDKADQIDLVKKEFPKVIALKMERPQDRHTDTKSELADYVVKDLYEAREIIKEVCKVK